MTLTRRAGNSAEPITICIVSPFGYGLYHPETKMPFGGAEVQLFLLARQLSRDPDYTVTVLTTTDKEPGTEQWNELTLIRRRRGCRLSVKRLGEGHSWWKNIMGYLSAFFEMLSVFRGIGAEIYLYAGSGAEVGAYALICRLLRKRFVYVVASLIDVSEVYGQVEGPFRYVHALGIRWAHAIVCRTRDQLNALASRYGRKGTLIRTGHALPAEIFSEPSSILWIGRVHPVKQPQIFLDIAHRIPGERFVMAAMRHTDYPDLWTNITEQASKMPNLSFHADIPFNLSDGVFKSAKLLVNTSCSEGFPNTFVQAALHGTPILSLNVDPDGVLTKSGMGICAEGSLDKLVTAIRLLCNDARMRQAHSIQAAAYAKEHHNLERTVAAFKELLRSLTGWHRKQDAAGVQG